MYLPAMIQLKSSYRASRLKVSNDKIPAEPLLELKNANEDMYLQSNMLPIVQVINNNKLQWFGHVTDRVSDVGCGGVNIYGKRPRGRPIQY